MTAAELALWLRSSPAERGEALDDLLQSRDLIPVFDGYGESFGVIRVDRLIPRLECPAPILAPGAA